MKLTKYEHACFTIEKDGKLLVVDPGAFTTDLGSPENVVAIVVTHEHQDHFDVNALGALIAHNPNAVILAHSDITRQLGDTLPTKSVDAEETFTIEPFSLEICVGEHAVIHPDFPAVANLGVMIDDSVFYPGDSFVNPKKPVATLALPVGAPWLKISQSMDYVTLLRPTFVFPTHDAVLSDIGKSLPDNMIPQFCDAVGAQYKRIDGTTIEI